MTRSAIRVPTNTPAEFTVTVVDLDGNILASAREGDTLVDSADVTPQKARSAVFWSRTDAASKISSLSGPSSSPNGTFAYYINTAQAFISATAFAAEPAQVVRDEDIASSVHRHPAGGL